MADTYDKASKVQLDGQVLDYAHYGISSEGKIYKRVGNDAKAPLNIVLPETLVDHFGYIKTSQGVGLWEDKRLFGKGDGWEDLIIGTASSAHVPADSTVLLTVGATLNDAISRQAYFRSPYVSGNTQEIEVTGNFLSNTATSTLKTVIRKNGVDDPTTQANFSDDVYTDFNADKFQLFRISFQWLGGGVVSFSRLKNKQEIILNEISHANEIDAPYMQNPSLPMKYEIINMGTYIIKRMGYYDGDNGLFFEVIDTDMTKLTMTQICSSVASLGGFSLPGNEHSVDNFVGLPSAVTTTEAPIIVIRLKNTFNGLPNTRTARFLHAHMQAQSQNILFRVAHLHAPTYNVSAWSDAAADSAVEYAFGTAITSITGSPRHNIHPIPVSSGQAGKGGEGGAEIDYLSKHNFISQNAASNLSQAIVIYARTQTGAGEAYVAIDWTEFD